VQFDFIDWLGKNILYLLLALGAVIIAYIVRAFYLRKSVIDDPRLDSPSFEEMDSGIKISDEDDDP
jgi:hypothetical protein